MKTVFNLILVLCCAVPPAPALAQQGPLWVERQAYLMGTVLHARVAAVDRAVGFAALEDAFQAVRDLETILSTWTPESEIARVNRAGAGEMVPLSQELTVLLAEAMEWSRRTDGAFDPAVGALVDAWDLRGEGRVPEPETLARAVRESGIDRYRLYPKQRRIRVPGRDAWLDTGGFGKGAALRTAESALRARGIRDAILDFGGQVVVIGAPAGGGRWEVAVAHPGERGTPAVSVRIPGGSSAATSAQSERFIEVKGRRYGHVLDPRRGLPVPAWGSVTVIADDPLAADVLSTALLVMGPEAGRRWAAGRDEGVLFLEVVGDDVVASSNAAFEQYRIDQSTTEG